MKPGSLVLSAIVAVSALAGCFGGPQGGDDAVPPRSDRITSEDDPRLSQPVYDSMVKEHVMVAASLDGVLLDNWVFRPDAEDAAFPVFINFSPYWGNLAPTAESGGDAFSQYLIDYFVPRGYAVVLSSARGTGFSHGCFNMGGDIEQQDSYDVVEHFANQPWSNGKVGAGGKSYDGTMPNGVLVRAPPSLRTIFPVSGISELYKYNYKGGIPYFQGVVFNTYYYALVGIANVDPGDATSLALVAEDLACPTLPENQAHGFGSGATGDYTQYWRERNYSHEAQQLIPHDAGVACAEDPEQGKCSADEPAYSVFFVHGLQDWNVKPDHILPFLTELKAKGVPVKAWLHQEGHVYPQRGDWNLTMLKWLDHWLKGVDTGIMDEPLVQVQDDSGVWRNEAFWPPESVVSASYWITPDSLDAGGAPAGGTIRYVDSNPPLAPMAAPTEVRLASAAVEEDVRLAGEARVHVRVAADQPRGVVVAELSVVDPDSGQWNRITWGGLNLRHHESLENGQLVVPQQEYAFSFPLHPVDAVVPAGHAIGLRLAGDGGEFLTPATGNAYTLHLGEDTYLELPWRPGTDVDIEDPQPEDVGCWAC